MTPASILTVSRVVLLPRPDSYAVKPLLLIGFQIKFGMTECGVLYDDVLVIVILDLIQNPSS